MSIKILVNPLETPTSSPKNEVGGVYADVRGGSGGVIQYQEVLPAEASGTSAAPTAITITRRGFSPDAEFKYVRNSSTNPIPSGDAVMIDMTATDDPAAVLPGITPTSNLLEGIAVRTIPAGFYGFIQIKGKVPAGVSSTNAEDRGGVHVASTNVLANDTVVLSATAGVLEEYSPTATTLGALAYNSLMGRRIRILDDSADLDPSTNTDIRAEAVIF